MKWAVWSKLRVLVDIGLFEPLDFLRLKDRDLLLLNHISSVQEMVLDLVKQFNLHEVS
jgi:hypothetical protein